MRRHHGSCGRPPIGAALAFAVGAAAWGCGTAGGERFLATLVGERVKAGVGLVGGEFTEFGLGRIRLVDAKVAAPHLAGRVAGDRDVVLRVAAATVDYAPLEVLWHRRIRRVEIDGPEVWLGELATDRAAGPGDAPADARPYRIEELVVRDLTLHVDNVAPSILLRLADDAPLVLRNVDLTDLSAQPDAEAAQTLHARNVLVTSGFGPMAPLATVDVVTLDFRWAGLAVGVLDGLTLEHPILHVGEDWFGILRDVPAAPVPAPEPSDAGLVLRRFAVERLQLALSSFGILDLLLPFTFDYAATDVRLDAAGRFFLRSTLSVREGDWELPRWGLRVEGLAGELAFNFPPERARENVVPTFTAARLDWADLVLAEPWVSATILPARPRSATQARTATGDARVDVRFGTYVGQSYLQGWIGTDFSLAWDASVDVWRTGSGDRTVFERLALPRTTGISARATGAGTRVADARATLVTTGDARVTLDASGEITRFLHENLAIAPSPVDVERAALAEAVTAQRLAWGELQQLKNLRVVGETRRGLLAMRVDDPEGAYPGATALVTAENDRRALVYEALRRRRGVAPEVVAGDYAARWRMLAFPGEWIETVDGAWRQK